MAAWAYVKQHLLGLLFVGLVFYVIERIMGARRRPGYFRPGMLTDAAYFFTLELFKQGRVDLAQAERFGDIAVTWNHDATESDLSPIDNYDG